MQIQPADRSQRRNAVIIIVVAAIALIVLFVAFDHWLQHAAQRMSTTELVTSVERMISACVILMSLCLLLLGRHLLLRGRRIVRDRRYPANDARPLRATPVREGDDAVRIGNASRVAGLIACLLGVAIAIAGWFWVAQMG
ncbi:MAG: hypothetical protein KGP08_04195 [Xanthomonadaceae bacterium]|nr:hypothetical protein [Xanthomonadaceae bacterium]